MLTVFSINNGELKNHLAVSETPCMHNAYGSLSQKVDFHLRKVNYFLEANIQANKD